MFLILFRNLLDVHYFAYYYLNLRTQDICLESYMCMLHMFLNRLPVSPFIW